MTPTSSGKLVVVLHAREDEVFREKLTTHLAVLEHAGTARIWHPGSIRPGEPGQDVTDARLAEADILVVLVSADYLANHKTEMDAAVSLARGQDKRLLPIVVRPCSWDRTPLANLRSLPASGQPVNTPSNDDAWTQITWEIAESLEGLSRPAPREPSDRGDPLPSDPAPPSPPLSPAHPDNAALRDLATGPDEPIRKAALQRLVQATALSAEDRTLLREHVGDLPLDVMVDLLHRHGHLDGAAGFVDRFIREMPQAEYHQEAWLEKIGAFDWLPAALPEEAYSDFVARAAPVLAAAHGERLLVAVRGCPLFGAIVEADGARPAEMREGTPGSLGMALLAVRWDQTACRAALASRSTGAGTAELIRLEWVLSRAGCDDMAASARRRLLDTFGAPTEQERAGRRPVIESAHWRFVQSWVEADVPDRRDRLAWLAGRIHDLERRGFSFFHASPMDRRFPSELRIAVGRILADRGQAPWWAGDILLDRLSSRTAAAWQAVFDWWRPWKRAQWRCDHAVRKAILAKAPLPEDAPDDFDERYFACVLDEMCWEENSMTFARDRLLREIPELVNRTMSAAEIDARIRGPVWDDAASRLRPFLTVRAALERLLGLPMTSSRATRLARMLALEPALLSHGRIGEVAAYAAPMRPDDLPPLTAVKLDDDLQVAVYRRLGGHAADERLRNHVRALVEADPSPADAVESLSAAWPWMQHVADDALRAFLRECLRDAPVWLAATVHARAPWLIDKHTLHRTAEQQLDGPWGWEIEHFPPSLAPLVLERARRTESEQELSQLLPWLDAHGLSRGDRAELWIERLEAGREWLCFGTFAAVLSTAAAWENEGARVLHKLVVRDAWLTVHDLWTTLPVSTVEAETLLRAAHGTFAKVLTDHVAEAAKRGDEPRALAFIDAIARLTPDLIVTERLRGLATSREVTDTTRARLDLARRLLEAAPQRAPSLQGLLDATEAAYRATAPFDGVMGNKLPGSARAPSYP